MWSLDGDWKDCSWVMSKSWACRYVASPTLVLGVSNMPGGIVAVVGAQRAQGDVIMAANCMFEGSKRVYRKV